MIAWNIWGSSSVLVASRMIFIFWEPSTPSLLEINFDGILLEGSRHGVAAFVIIKPDSIFAVVQRSLYFDLLVLRMELQGAIGKFYSSGRRFNGHHRLYKRELLLSPLI